MKTIYKEETERKNGMDAGRMAARNGCRKAIFGENNNRSITYQIAYNKAYDEASASSNEEKKERRKGRRAGRDAAKNGWERSIFRESNNRSIAYQIAYNEAYDEASASFNEEEKERSKGRNAGRNAAKSGCKRTIFGENDNRSIIYQKAYNEAYDREVAKKGKSERDFPLTQDAPEYGEEFNSEFFCPQQNLFSSLCFPDFSTPDVEYTLDYSEKLNPPQEPDTVINSVEKLSEYPDSLSSPAPDAHPLNLLLLQDKATSLNFDRVGDLLGVYETIQPTSLYQPRLYQPLFFITRVPQESGIIQEAPIHFIADRII